MIELDYSDALSRKIYAFWQLSKCWNGRSSDTDLTFTVETAIKQCDELLTVINPNSSLSQKVLLLRGDIISYGNKSKAPTKQCK